MTHDPNTPLPPPPILPYAHPVRPCPGCGGGPLEEPSFTWWGGFVGHKVLGLEQCAACGRWWVKSTGRPGTGRIAAYVLIGLVLGLALGVVWAST